MLAWGSMSQKNNVASQLNKSKLVQNHYHFVYFVSLALASIFFIKNELALLALLILYVVAIFRQKEPVFLAISAFYLSFIWLWDSSSDWILTGIDSGYIKAFLLVSIGSIYLKDVKNFNLNVIALSLALLAILCLSFLRSSNMGVAVKYFLNLYFPFVLMLLILSSSRVYYPRCGRAVNAFIYSVVLFSFCSSIIVVLTNYSLLEFLSLGISDNRTDSELKEVLVNGDLIMLGGGLVTSLFGYEFIRNPGAFVDPILAGYILAFSFIYIMFFQKKSKYFFLTLCGVSLLLTFSKGAWLIAFFAIVSTYANMLIWEKGLFAKIFVNVVLFFTFLSTLLFQAVDGVGSSAFLHFLGLSQTFIEFPSLLGNDLGSGGNYANLDFFEKLKRGAESTIGVVFYHIGYLGLAVFLLAYFFCVGILLRKKEKEYAVLVSLMISQLAVSFLQENTFNLGYLLPRLFIFYGIFYAIQSKKIRPENLEAGATTSDGWGKYGALP